MAWLAACLICTHLVAQDSSQQGSPQTLSLQSAQRRFAERNPRVEALRQGIESARGLAVQAAKPPNPTLHYSQEGLPLGRDGIGFDDQEFLLWASQPFELGGKRGRRREAADSQVRVLELQLEDFLRRGRAQVARAYLGVLHQQQQRDLIGRLLQQYRQLRRSHQLRLAEGDVSGLSHLKVEAEELRYTSLLARADTELAEAWRELSAWTDWPGAIPPRLQAPQLLGEPRQAMEALRRRALAQRSDLRALQARVEEEQARLALRRAEKIPDLTVGGGFKRDFGQNSFYVGINVPLPLFDRNQGAVASALAQVESARNELRWRQILAGKQVEEAWKRFNLQRGQAQRLQGTVIDRLETIVDVTSQSYNEGESSLLELLDAMRVQLEASLNFQTLLLQARLSRVDLEEAVGGTID
ncbi:MAG TPA: TolC family protein [Acidobacteriota bacterium]|nr:TolC family protein [Acidobacteriota bacterium]